MNTENQPRKFAPPGPLLLDPRAYGMAILLTPEPPSTRIVDRAAVVPVRGPLMQYADPFCDSYEAIRGRVEGALAAGNVRAVVLEISSPGGLVAGCFETGRQLRAMCDAADVPLLAYVDGQATSAAYALASCASRIVIPPTGIVGSIGCISELTDTSALDAAMGLRVSVVASGSRKLHGNPHVPTSDAAIATAQGIVNALAEEFFAHVAGAGRVSPDALRALDGGLYIGANAVRLGLADAVGGLGDAIGAVRVVARPTAPSNDARPMAVASFGTSLVRSAVPRAALVAPARKEAPTMRQSTSTSAPTFSSSDGARLLSSHLARKLTDADRTALVEGAVRARRDLSRSEVAALAATLQKLDRLERTAGITAVGAPNARIDRLEKRFAEPTAAQRAAPARVEAARIDAENARSLAAMDRAFSSGPLVPVITRAPGRVSFAMSTVRVSKEFDDAVAKLRELAKGDDKEDARRAKRLLAALVKGDDKEDDAKAKRHPFLGGAGGALTELDAAFASGRAAPVVTRGATFSTFGVGRKS